MAYVTPSAKDESPKTFKGRLYNTLHAIAVAKRGAREIRATQIRPLTGRAYGTTYIPPGYQSK